MKENLKKIFADPRVAKYQLLILSLGSVLICTLLIIFLIVPQAFKLINANSEIENTKSKIDALNTKIGVLESLNVDEYKTDLSLSLTALPEEKDIPSVIGQILSTVSASGLTLESFTFGNSSQDPNNISNFQANISVTGDRQAIKTFFDNLNQASRIMKVSNLDLTSSGGINRASATIDITAYYQPLPTKIGDIESPVTPLSAPDKEVIAKISKSTSPVINAQSSSESGIPSAAGKSDPFE